MMHGERRCGTSEVFENFPSGHYQAIHRPPGEVVPASVTFTARMDAEAWLIAEREWTKNRRNSKGEPLRPTTRDKCMSHLCVHVFPEFGDTPSDEITRTTVRAWHDNLETGPAARADSNSTLLAILNTAVLDDVLLARNPAYIRGAGVKSFYVKLRPAALDELAVMMEAGTATAPTPAGHVVCPPLRRTTQTQAIRRRAGV